MDITGCIPETEVSSLVYYKLCLVLLKKGSQNKAEAWVALKTQNVNNYDNLFWEVAHGADRVSKVRTVNHKLPLQLKRHLVVLIRLWYCMSQFNIKIWFH